MKVICPKMWREQIMEAAHSSSKEGGHFGEFKSIRKCRLLTRATIHKDFKEYIKTCLKCQLYKKDQIRIPLTPVEVSSTLAKIAVDLYGPMVTPS